MNKDRAFGVIRSVLSVAGAFLLGKNLFGTAIDESTWQVILGIVMGLVGMAWSIVDKTATLEMVQGAIRQGLTFVGGLLVASGKLSAANLETWLGIITAILPFLYAGLSRKKTQALDNGKLSVDQLNK